MSTPNAAKSRGSILLAEDDDVFRGILTTDLSEQGFTVTDVDNGAAAVERFNATPGFHAVVSDVRMPVLDGIGLLKQLRTASQVPVVLISGASEIKQTADATQLGANAFISKPFPIQALVSVLDEVIATARKNETDADFAKIGIDDFVSGSIIPYNIYVRASANKYIRVANKGVDLDIERIREYKARGARFLYLRKRDFEEYLRAGLTIAHRIQGATQVSPDRKLRFLRHMGEVILEKCSVIGVDRTSLDSAREFLGNVSEVLSDDVQAVTVLEHLNDHADFLYAHSVGVSLFAILIAQKLGWRASPTSFRLGIAGLMHDIGKKELSKDLLNKPRHMHSPGERAEYESHCARGVDILQSLGTLPEEVIQAVAQHHEEPGGTGFPRKLRGDQITPMAQIISVANLFCRFTIASPNKPNPLNAADAILQIEQFHGNSVAHKFLVVLKDVVT